MVHLLKERAFIINILVLTLLSVYKVMQSAVMERTIPNILNIKYLLQETEVNQLSSDHKVRYKGRRQNSLPLTTNCSRNVTEPYKGISYPVGDLCRHFTKLTGSSANTLQSNLIPQQMV